MANQPKKKLQEKDFIHEGYSQNPFPLWVWFFVLTAVMAIYWGGYSWYTKLWFEEVSRSPFLQVTNRQLSVFLWQFPEYMRVNASSKSGYLTGFQYHDKVSLFPLVADEYAAAPPSLLFLYHSWDRLIRKEWTSRLIPKEEFLQFLAYAEEWLPAYWPQAPKEYAGWVNKLKNGTAPEELSGLSDDILPIDVRQAFEGWKNFMKEGEAINKAAFTFEQLAAFLKKNPHYARSNWRNIMDENYPRYLWTYSFEKFDLKEQIPQEEVAPFLRVALFNFLQK